jgi:hypothetical protein
MTFRNLRVVSLAALLAVTACKSLTAGGSDAAYVRDAMRDYRFPKACDALWVDALKVISAEEYGMVGTDRELTGQDKQGFVTNFLNRGHATTKDDQGIYESESDANSQNVRIQVRGKPAGTDGCFVQYFSILDDRINSVERRHRDYDLELKLLAKVDPAAAAKIATAADATK